MRKILLFAFLLCVITPGIKAQDKLYMSDGTIIESVIKEISPEEISYQLFSAPNGPMHVVNKSLVFKITYKNGLTETFNTPKSRKISYRELMALKFDSSFVKKNFARVYFTDIFLCKFSLGYERLINKDYSFEVDAFFKYKIANGYNYYDWQQALLYNSQGGELRLGGSRHFSLKRSRFSAGLSVSYRQQNFSGLIDGFSISHVSGAYSLSQHKKGAGMFLKLNFQPRPQHTSLEFFVMAGTYATFTKNHYNYFQKSDSPYGATTNPAQIPKISNKYMKDGFAMLPYVNAGAAVIIKQPQNGWHKKVLRQRDSLQFKKKNILLINPFEMLDGAIGFTYMHVFTKRALSAYSSLAFGYGSAVLSNGLLLENNLNYSVNNKNADVTLGLNHNFTKAQKSFPFIGIAARLAQFEGTYMNHGFTLNKYYALLNAGYVLRSKAGATLMFTVSPGHYFNDYVRNNPAPYIQADHFYFRETNKLLNAFNTSVQFGFSF